MIVLLGYMGSGKTVVGQVISGLIGFEFVDLDHYIEFKEGKKISEIFERNGAIYFRKIENKYLKELIKEDRKVILSLGGGTPCYYNNMELLLNKSYIRIFYLSAGIKTLLNRLNDDKINRPIISGITGEDELLEFIGKHLFERRPYYQRAHHQITVDDKSLSQISKEIISTLF
ncbi:shikimate kinase I [Nonlabens ulvanivorans]|uniref:Shikimate kinase n=1 Tax=Nonlabens ulvanivorans TaxID=906888 RepID=A0A090WG35_NONUL|nr:shikimate kinase [Nonlabens ulvanivorans]GAL75931.1 shikimate kinase I [Nonlabens ulvanivorans]